MNLAGFQPIHESNLKRKERYYFKNRFGEGMVEAVKSTLDGWQVEIKEGGFNTPRTKYKRGDTMLVPNGEGKFYEVKG